MTTNDTPIAGGPWQVGADIGGTFTDVIALDAHARVVATKVLSTPPDFHRGVIDGVDGRAGRGRRRACDGQHTAARHDCGDQRDSGA